MFKTPTIPTSIKSLSAPAGFVNPFKMGIEGPNLFGTEAMCGDWDGDLLLLAQDFAPAEVVQAVIKNYGAKRAWRHNDGDGRYSIGEITNHNICQNLGFIGRDVDIAGRNSLNCSVVYGNACFFLKEGKASPKKGVVASKPVFDFVIQNMPNLRAIACLGQHAFDGVMIWNGTSADWKVYRDARKPARVGRFGVFALSHPGQLGINGRLQSATYEERLAAVKADWEAVGNALS